MIINDIAFDSDGEPNDFIPMEPSFATHVNNGRAHAATNQPQLADAASEELVIDNTTTDKVIFVKNALVRGAGFADIDVYKGRNIDTAGNSETTNNLKVGDASVNATVDSGGSYSGGTKIFDPMIPGGSGTLGSTVNHGSWESPPILIPPGESASMVVTNQTGGTEEYELAVVFAEVPV